VTPQDAITLALASGLKSLPVRVERMLPYESTDPDKPGPVHAVMIAGTLFVSREAFEALKKAACDGKL
jgi:hypothetical protein